MKSILSFAKTLPALLLTAVLLLSTKCAAPSSSAAAGTDSTATATTTATAANLSSILTEQQFNTLFPTRDKFYTYAAFIKAAKALGLIKVQVNRRATSVYQLIRTDKTTGKSTIVRQDEDWNEDWAKNAKDSTYTIDYGLFCSEKDAQTNKKELAAFFANIAHETRHGQDGQYTDGLMYLHENDTSLAYISDNDSYPPVAGKKYYGRGPIQLSYNGNYGYASDCIFGDKRVLLNNPALVETDAVVAFKTAIYFWMTPQTQKPSAHDVMVGKWQPSIADKAAGRVPVFGMTINIVNGSVECGKGENVFSMNDRIGFYKFFLKQLGATDPNPCSCGAMKPY
jgi:hypothetical protein